MKKMRLGKTELIISRTGFGALPIQRVNFETARKILRKAYDNKITFFDTANMYSDSEEKIGYALADVRDKIIIATKSGAADKEGVFKHIKQSLNMLRTDYIDILQLHYPRTLPDPNDKNSSYQALVDVKAKGIVRHIGITTHKLDDAVTAVKSGLYETLQFPLSALSSEKELGLIDLCKTYDVGLIAMKALCGGLLYNAELAFTFLRQYENVVPIWGIQKEEELDEFLELESNPSELNNAMLEKLKKERLELAGNFCRSCGYCLPCPANIDIPQAARMYFLLRRMPSKNFLTAEWKQKMEKVNDCVNCGECKSKCPYDLDTPKLLKRMYDDYVSFG